MRNLKVFSGLRQKPLLKKVRVNRTFIIKSPVKIAGCYYFLTLIIFTVVYVQNPQNS